MRIAFASDSFGLFDAARRRKARLMSRAHINYVAIQNRLKVPSEQRSGTVR